MFADPVTAKAIYFGCVIYVILIKHTRKYLYMWRPPSNQQGAEFLISALTRVPTKIEKTFFVNAVKTFKTFLH